MIFKTGDIIKIELNLSGATWDGDFLEENKRKNGIWEFLGYDDNGVSKLQSDHIIEGGNSYWHHDLNLSNNKLFVTELPEELFKI